MDKEQQSTIKMAKRTHRGNTRAKKNKAKPILNNRPKVKKSG